MFFHENTHICEENEGDQESHAHQHNTHTWTQDEKKMKQLEKTWRKHQKRTFSENHAFLMKIHIYARKTRATRNAPPFQNKKKHICQNDAENKTRARKNKNKHELSAATQKKKTFWNAESSDSGVILKRSRRWIGIDAGSPEAVRGSPHGLQSANVCQKLLNFEISVKNFL